MVLSSSTPILAKYELSVMSCLSSLVFPALGQLQRNAKKLCRLVVEELMAKWLVFWEYVLDKPRFFGSRIEALS